MIYIPNEENYIPCLFIIEYNYSLNFYNLFSWK